MSFLRLTSIILLIFASFLLKYYPIHQIYLDDRFIYPRCVTMFNIYLFIWNIILNEFITLLESSSTLSTIIKFMNNLEKLQILNLSEYFFCQLYESPKLPVYIEKGEESWDLSYQWNNTVGAAIWKKKFFNSEFSDGFWFKI